MRNLSKEEDVDVVLSADKIFLRFHETTREVLAPKGVKRVGVALSVNEKYAFFVIITLDIFVNIVLPTFIIFICDFGAYLMNEYEGMTKATIPFTDTH